MSKIVPVAVMGVEAQDFVPHVWGKPPSFTGSLDTDFNGTLGPWSASGSPGTVDMLNSDADLTIYDLGSCPGCVLLQAGVSDAVTLSATYTLADGESIVVPLFGSGPVSMSSDNMSVVLRALEGANHITIMLEQDSTEWVVQGNSSADATGVEVAHGAPGAGPVMFRITRSGTTYRTFFSNGGGSWHHVFARASVSTPYSSIEITLTNNAASGPHPIVAIPWTKLIANSSFRPW